LAVLATGLLARILVTGAAPHHGYAWDHFDNIGMGRTAAAVGLLHVYTVEMDDLAAVHGTVWKNGAPETVDRRAIMVPNYPPLAITIFCVQSSMLAWIQHPLTANSFLARLSMASIPIAFEWLAALAIGAIASRLFGEKRRLPAIGLAWLFPPIFLNSCLWGQVDAFFLAPAAWAVLLILDRRWAAAGIVAGIACLLKPQGVLLLVPAALGAFVIPDGADSRPPSHIGRRLFVLFGSAAAAVLLLSFPWMIESGLAWIRRSYVTSFLHAFPDTTLYAFNIWYADMLRLDGRPVMAIDSHARLLGITKDTWGRTLFMAASAAILWTCWRRIRPGSTALVYGSAMFLWNAFLFPTRVHERFILYSIPFMIVLGVGMRRLRPALLILLIVGSAEQSWNLWMHGPPAGSLITRRVVDARLDEISRARGASGGDGAAHPTQADAVASLAAQARASLPDYARARRGVRPLEILFTTLSLAGYLAAIIGRPRRESYAGRAGKPTDTGEDGQGVAVGRRTARRRPRQRLAAPPWHGRDRTRAEHPTRVAIAQTWD
jgi:hypothetical protein